jgi:hypothetical protein
MCSDSDHVVVAWMPDCSTIRATTKGWLQRDAVVHELQAGGSADYQVGFTSDPKPPPAGRFSKCR